MKYQHTIDLISLEARKILNKIRLIEGQYMNSDCSFSDKDAEGRHVVLSEHLSEHQKACLALGGQDGYNRYCHIVHNT